MRAEYRFDYSKAVRGKYHQLLMEGSNVVFQQNPTSGKIKYTDEPLGDLRVIPISAWPKSSSFWTKESK